MTTDEYDELLASIRANGLLEPVVLYEGKILDGLHRARACTDARVALRTVTWKPTRACPTPLRYVLAKNVHRRHLSVGQRAALAYQLAEKMRKQFPVAHGGNTARIAKELGVDLPDTKGIETLDVVGEALKVSPSSIEVYATLEHQAPELADKVADGTRDLYQADWERRRQAREPRRVLTPSESAQALYRDARCALKHVERLLALKEGMRSRMKQFQAWPVWPDTLDEQLRQFARGLRGFIEKAPAEAIEVKAREMRLQIGKGATP